MLEYLPFEIITPITHLLDTKDYHTCLTINQLWYSVFIKFVSERVKISCTHHLETFLTLITRSSRSMRASKYIKYLDLHLMSTEDKDRYNTIIRSYLLNALIHCPNLETLSVISTDATIQTIMNPNMPRLTRLKYLKFSMVNHEYNLMGCYYKFRSSLTHLTLHTLAVSQRDYDEGTILSYLGSFPCLVSLDINLDQNLTIADVLKHCSTLTHLHYISMICIHRTLALYTVHLPT
ncbi:hypothetical protein BDB01DRAFT_81424 [Pilobolus umbonatus]|nr:hypothetical protein BDB01DRAFT_81424 [Pilobolus umbonatus]